MSKIVIYSPGAFVGGGIVLLQSLFDSLNDSASVTAILDRRASDALVLPADVNVIWVDATVFSRLWSFFTLHKLSVRNCTVFCFTGAPPIFGSCSKYVLFLQNRLLIEENIDYGYTRWVFARLLFERMLLRGFIARFDKIIVQTESMRRGIIRRFPDIEHGVINVLPFAPSSVSLDASGAYRRAAIPSDRAIFLYVADGMAHKNHIVLLEAWLLLAREGIRPKLILTLGGGAIRSRLESYVGKFGADICNVGQCSRSDIVKLYRTSSALIYPSLCESFGLPLLEATEIGLPILAGELDYVRDVCQPQQTFDPSSAVSIARAVKRFLGNSGERVRMSTASDFWREVERN